MAKRHYNSLLGSSKRLARASLTCLKRRVEMGRWLVGQEPAKSEPGIHAHFDDFKCCKCRSLWTSNSCYWISINILSRMNTAAMVAGHSVEFYGETIEFPMPAALLRWCHCACGSQTHGKVCTPFSRRPAGGSGFGAVHSPWLYELLGRTIDLSKKGALLDPDHDVVPGRKS